MFGGKELVQAATMVPVFLVHLGYYQKRKLVSWVGMIHSMISSMMHFHVWWQQQGDWPLWAVELYIADKCMIMIMIWCFQYHLDPSCAKRTALPSLVNVVQIFLYQHQYLHSRYAYFDIVLWVHCSMTILVYLYKTYPHSRSNLYLAVMPAIGYELEIPGLMHLCLAPGFCLFYEYSNEERKIFITNKKEHAL